MRNPARIVLAERRSTHVPIQSAHDRIRPRSIQSSSCEAAERGRVHSQSRGDDGRVAGLARGIQILPGVSSLPSAIVKITEPLTNFAD